MSYVKPGEHPLVDMFEYGKHPFPYDIEMMLRKLNEIDTDLLDEFEKDFIRWAKGINLDKGRKRLKQLLIDNNVSEKEINEIISPPKPGADVFWVRNLSRIIAIVWALWWVIFTYQLFTLDVTVGETHWTEGTNIQANWTTILMAGIFLVSALIPFKWEPLGGILLILEGLFITVAYMDDIPQEKWLDEILFLFIVGIPAVIAGLGFLIAWTRSKKSPFKHIEEEESK